MLIKPFCASSQVAHQAIFLLPPERGLVGFWFEPGNEQNLANWRYRASKTRFSPGCSGWSCPGVSREASHLAARASPLEPAMVERGTQTSHRRYRRHPQSTNANSELQMYVLSYFILSYLILSCNRKIEQKSEKRTYYRAQNFAFGTTFRNLKNIATPKIFSQW